MFRNREDAGRRLAIALDAYRITNPLVLAIPRGGVEVAYQVADRLNAELAALVVRKLPLPRNPEAGFGAIAEDGSTFVFEHMAAALPEEVVGQIIETQKREVQRRIDVLRKGESLPNVADRTVILVDDGIAMGSTIRAGIKMCRNKRADQVIVAAPVASPSTVEQLDRLADDVVVVEQPQLFRAVAQVYENWYDVPDEEVIKIMDEYQRQHA